MDVQKTLASQAADAALNNDLESALVDSKSPGKRRQRRLERIDEYEEAALEHADPLAACLGAVNADLLVLAEQVGAVIREELADRPSAETIINTAPMIGLHANLARQIGRYSEFQLRAAEAQREVEHHASGRPRHGAPGTATHRIGVAPNPWRDG